MCARSKKTYESICTNIYYISLDNKPPANVLYKNNLITPTGKEFNIRLKIGALWQYAFTKKVGSSCCWHSLTYCIKQAEEDLEKTISLAHICKVTLPIASFSQTKQNLDSKFEDTKNECQQKLIDVQIKALFKKVIEVMC